MTPVSILFRTALAGVLLLAGSSAAHAADTLLATCKDDGASFHHSNVSEADAAVVYDLPPAPGDGAVLVVDADGNNARWSTASRSAIDRECGGNGDDEITLFEPVQPRDGLWTAHLVGHDMQGCPSMIASRTKAMLPGIMQKQGARNLEFDKPFHPRGLMEGERVQWVQTGADRWRGVVMMENGGRGGMSVSVVTTVQVLSPTHMQGTNTVTFDFPPQLAALMGGGSGHCVSVAQGDFTWSE